MDCYSDTSSLYGYCSDIDSKIESKENESATTNNSMIEYSPKLETVDLDSPIINGRPFFDYSSFLSNKFSYNLNSTVNNEINSINQNNFNNSKKITVENNIEYNKFDLKIAFLIVSLGCSTIFPFQSLIASIEYFHLYLFPNYRIPSVIPFLYLTTIAITFILLLRFQKHFKPYITIIVGYCVFICFMIITPCININTEKNSFIKFTITLILISFNAIFDGLCQGALFSIASKFGPIYTACAQSGIGLAGIIVIITRLICKLSFPNTENGLKIGTLIFFSISSFFVLFTLIIFIYSLRSPIGYIITEKNENKKDIENKNNNNNNNNNNNMIEMKIYNTTISKEKNENTSKEVEIEQEKLKSPFKYVLKKNLQYSIIVFYIFLISLFLYPGLLFQIKSTKIRVDWFCFIMIGIYNLGDTIGKFLPLIIHNPTIGCFGNQQLIPTPNIKILWIISIGRSIFVLLFFLSIYFRSIFGNEIIVFSFILIFGLTNGYTSTVTLAEGPKNIENEFKGLTAILLTTSLNFGLLFGSALCLLATFLM